MWIGEIWRRLRFITQRRRFERDLEDEMRLHVDLRSEEHELAGVADARHAAERRFGQKTQLKEESRSMWMIAGSFFQDVRYGVRAFAKTRGFTVLAVLTLALGIGASSAVFTLIDAILLKPLPYPEADRIVLPWRMSPPGASLGFDEFPWGIRDFHLFERQDRVFEHVAAFKSDSFNLTGSGEPELLEGIRASAAFFPVLRSAPALGRVYTAAEDRAGHEFEVVLSDELWRNRFSADVHILGRQVALNGYSYTVIGVMPPGFAFPKAEEMPGSFNFPRRPQLWVPFALADAPYPTQPDDLALVARLRPAISIAQAQAAMNVHSAELDRQFPRAKGWFNSRVTPFEKQVAGDTRRPLLLMLAAVGVVLLIACSNVANLLLARSLARRREFTVRAALGAGRMRLIRQLLTESLLLAVAAGIGGLFLANAGVEFVKAFGPSSIPRLHEAGLDLKVFAFAAGVSLVTGILFGLAPALGTARENLADALRDGARGSSSTPVLRNALLVFQVALAFVLVIAAGLVVRTFSSLLRVDPGFNATHVISFKLSLPESKYGETSNITNLFGKMLANVRAIPGVESAGIGETVPMDGTGESTVIGIPDNPPIDKMNQPMAVYTIASPGYFGAVGTPLLRGRLLEESDTATSTFVTVVSKTMAEKFWPGKDALGKRVMLGSPRFPAMTIVGIVADVKHLSLREGPAPEMYVPYTQKPYPSMLVMRVVVRTRDDPAAAGAYIRDAVRRADAELPVAELETLTGIVERSLTQPRFVMLLLAGFGGLALLLASVGMYGVISYSVTRRTQEIGIRMALGAQRGDVFGMIVGGGARLAGLGIAIGLGAALVVTRAFASFLYGVPPYDPVTFGVVSLLLTGVALAACYVPARRAMRLNPTIALRYE